MFSPVNAYQEAYPGALVSFKFRVAAPQPLTSFGIRFKLPGETEFKALPQYPDQTGNANNFSEFNMFEYALPPSATDLDADVQVKFVAATAAKEYEQTYTVRLKKSGLQNFKLYSEEAATLFNFPALDLADVQGVQQEAAVATKDLMGISVTRTFPLEGVSFKVLHGFHSGNDTRFKLVNAANYNGDVANYATIYSGIAADKELTGASTILSNPLEGIGALAVNQFYIAKVMRNSTAQYVGLSIKRAPAITSTNAGGTTSVNLANEFLQLEIKK